MRYKLLVASLSFEYRNEETMKYEKPKGLNPLKDNPPTPPSKQSWLIVEGTPRALAKGCDRRPPPKGRLRPLNG